MKEGTRTVAGKYLCTVSSICVCAPRAHKELRREELECVTAISSHVGDLQWTDKTKTVK